MIFTAYQAKEKDELAAIFRLRYKVYVEEWGYERVADHPGGLERDEFDDGATHFMTKDEKGNIVGTVRLILDSPAGFPIEKYCHVDISKSGVPRKNISEISRLAISKEYRKRTEDKFIYGPDEERRSIGNFNLNYALPKYFRRSEDTYPDSRRTRRSHNERRVRHETVVSLYKAIYCESKKRGVTHWYAAMTKGLHILLRKFGINFQQIGDPVDYHGIRTPYIGIIERIEENVSLHNPELFREFNECLKG